MLRLMGREADDHVPFLVGEIELERVPPVRQVLGDHLSHFRVLFIGKPGDLR